MGMLRPRPVAWLAELVTVLAARHAGRWPMSGPWSAPRHPTVARTCVRL